MTSIQIDQLALRRKTGFELGPLDLDLPAGSRTALIGPSGCGKTTLLRCIAGLERPDRGTIRLDGRVVFDASMPRRAVSPGERRTGFVFQDGALWPHLSALQHLRFANPALSIDEARDRLAQVHLADRAERRPASLSGGEAQRLALARALATDPALLLLDEPLHSVDVALRDQLALLIHEIAAARSLTTVLVTHDRDEALALADHLLILYEGKVLEGGTAQHMLTTPSTAFGAAFLSGAACLPATPDGSGGVGTAFGRFAHSDRNGHGDGPVALVVLPGDLRSAAAGDAHTARGRILRVHADGTGTHAVVVIDGHTVIVPCDVAPGPGSEFEVALRGPVRLLPTGEEAAKR